MRAVIYCRVSTVEQAQNLSLPTQEQACRDYCARHGYEVDVVFVDAGESAKTTDRPEFRRLLEHCRRGRGRLHAVIVYALTRFSRNNTDHHTIRTLLRGFGITLRSVTESIDDSASGRLMEGILASFAQFDNDQRAERVTAGMKAAADRGRWVWPAPIGYLNSNHRGRNGPSLVPDPERAAAVREAFELCAAGIVGQALLQRVRDLGLRTKHGHAVSQSRLYELLRQPVYTGIVRQAAWGTDQRGDFEALVGETVFARAQAQLSRPARRGPLPREDRGRARTTDDAFPLRRFTRCAQCGRALTGSTSRGRNGARYPFYHCTRGCVRFSKVALEQQFVELLDQLRPHPAYWKLLKADVLDAWREHQRAATTDHAAARRRVIDLEQKLERLNDAFIDRQAIDERTYRARRDTLAEEIALASIDAGEASAAAFDLDSLLAFAEHTLTHAGALWTAETCTSRRVALQWTLFPTGIRAQQSGVIETPVTCLEFFELPPRHSKKIGLVDRPVPSWKHVSAWLTSFRQFKAA